MGRVTCFTVSTCTYCMKIKDAFTELAFEFTEIPLDLYPERRADMVRAANRLVVPQIFFNDRHIGGGDEMEALIKTGEAREMYAALMTEPAPTLPELAEPADDPAPPERPSERREEEFKFGRISMLYTELLIELENELTIKDHIHLGVVYKRTFHGKDLVTFLIDAFNLKSREAAISAGTTLQEAGLFSVVGHAGSSEKTEPLQDTGKLYRLHNHQQRLVLNSQRQWNDRVDKPGVTIRACFDMLSQIERRAASDGLVDYIKMFNDVSWPDFEDAVCELQRIEFGAMSENEQLAFCLNVYNLATKHAMVKVGIAKSDIRRLQFFDKVGYCIGGHVYSLNQIENGLLRGNKVAPFHFHKPFRPDDPRLKFAMPQGNHQIHFALNCGARSCSPVTFYTAEAVREELRLMSAGYVEMDEHVRVDTKTKTLWLAAIFSWYRSDFGPTKREMVKIVADLASSDKKETLNAWLAESESHLTFKIRYIPHDWHTNASASKTFNPANFRTEAMLACSLM